VYRLPIATMILVRRSGLLLPAVGLWSSGKDGWKYSKYAAICISWLIPGSLVEV
jgi:hypothetical protein